MAAAKNGNEKAAKQQITEHVTAETCVLLLEHVDVFYFTLIVVPVLLVLTSIKLF